MPEWNAAYKFNIFITLMNVFKYKFKRPLSFKSPGRNIIWNSDLPGSTYLPGLHMKKIFLLVVFSCVLCKAQQNLGKNYMPLKSSGKLPEVFTQNVQNVIKEDINELKKTQANNRGLKTHFLTASNYQIERIIRSGYTLINDEVTNYLNKITDVILKDNPGLRKQLHIFTLKSHVVNAYSFDKGYVFIDIGLIAQAETEAQLAYIICHEISHYTKQHHINSYVKNAEIDNRHYNRYNNEDRIIEKCQYSKENESEADIEGFKLYERTGYNLKQAEKAFDMLQYAHLPFELVEVNKAFFETPGYVLPETYFLKEVSAIKDNSNEDDSRQTHPNTRKRKQAIGEIVANRDNSNRVNALMGQETFEYIRDLARMELCRLYLKNRDYPNALYAAYILSLKYPSNSYIAEVISKCLYAISLHGHGEISYSKSSHLENGFASYNTIESYPQQLYYLISKMPEHEWTIMALNYVYRAHKRIPENNILAIYSDSLFSLMKRIKWGISDFARVPKQEEQIPDSTLRKETSRQPESKTELIANLQKKRTQRSDDTVYYKEVFLDLFMNDKEFSEKFPMASGDNLEGGHSFSGFTNYGTSTSVRKNAPQKINIHKLIVLDPYYIKIDETQRDEIQYVASDQRKEKYRQTLENFASRLEMDLITIDPSILRTEDVDKVNDYSLMNDWFEEKLDTEKEHNKILNTDEMEILTKKYATPYILKTGIATVVTRKGKKRTYFYGLLYDVYKNELIYRKYDYFRTKDRKDLVNAKTYQMLYELKHARYNQRR